MCKNNAGITTKRSILIFALGIKDNSAKKTKATIITNEILSIF